MPKICSECGEKTLSKNEIGLCKKLLGEQSKRLLCIDCLAQFLDVTVELLQEKIEEFQEEGCTLFEPK